MTGHNRAIRLVDRDGHQPTRCITFVGAGPAAAGVVERIAANQAEIDDRPLIIHLVDPYPPGAGRIWRDQQSGLLKLNSMATDVTMFTDDSSTIDGPIAPGPDLATWAELVRTRRIADVEIDPDTDPELAAELEGLRPESFPTRRLHERYMTWCLERSADRLQPGSKVMWHRAEVVRVSDAESGAQIVELDSGDELTTDLVIYSFGHLGSHVSGEAKFFTDFASAKGARYVAPAFTADLDYSDVAAGEEVLVRGLGLAAVDLVVLLTLGRGGAFVRERGELRYVPSGREPKLLLSSRRGVPYRSKVSAPIRGANYEPRFLTPEIAQTVAGSVTELEFYRDLWPLIERELHLGYYLELFTGSPRRVALTWEEFLEGLSTLDLHGDEYRALVERAVPDAADRLDVDALNRPLAGETFDTPEQLQARLREHMRGDLLRRTDNRYSENTALFVALFRAYVSVAELATAPNWQPESYLNDFQRRWYKFFSYIASGPPGERIEQLIALSEAGVIEFLGADVHVRADGDTGEFVATTPSLPGERRSRTLIDAWLPDASIGNTDSAVLRDLIDSGAGREQVVGTTPSGYVDVRLRDGRLIRAGGGVHPRRYAVGPGTSTPQTGAFARPHIDALSFRTWDRIARAILGELVEIRGAGDHPAAHRGASDAELEQIFDGAAYFQPDTESTH